MRLGCSLVISIHSTQQVISTQEHGQIDGSQLSTRLVASNPSAKNLESKHPAAQPPAATGGAVLWTTSSRGPTVAGRLSVATLLVASPYSRG